MSLIELTNKQKKFVDEYLKDLNATRAYKAAYPNVKKDEVAAVNGSRLLRNAKVDNCISERMKKREQRTEITQDRVLREIAKLGFFDPRKLFHADGRPKDITELDDDTAACIAGLDVLEQYEGSGEDRVFVGYIKKYKLTDKKGSLELLGRHLGMWKDKMELSGSVDIGNPYANLTEDELRKLAGTDDG